MEEENIMVTVIEIIIGFFLVLFISGIHISIVIIIKKLTNRKKPEQYQSLKEKTYISQLTEWAESRGWYYQNNSKVLWKQFNDLPFVKSKTFEADDVFLGTYKNIDFVAFEYSYTVSRGEDNLVTQYISIVSIRLPATLPKLQIGPEIFYNKLLGRDMQFESKEFNDKFRIDTDSARFASDVLSPTVMEKMIQDERYTQWPYIITENNLLTWLYEPMECESIEPKLHWLVEIMDDIPAFVWDNIK